MKDKIDGVTFDEFLDRRIAEMQLKLKGTGDGIERAFLIGRINAFQSIEIIWLGVEEYKVHTLKETL